MHGKKEDFGTELAHECTDLALKRTAMAATRTLMAWVRTGISQISFGFTAYKVLDSFKHEGKLDTKKFITPEKVGVTLLVLGLIAIIFGIIEYWGTYREYGIKPRRMPVLMAGAVALLGLGLLLAIFFNF